MCERFSLMSGVTELFDRFELNDIRMSLRPRSDYAPTRTVPVIVNEQGQRKLEGYRWGLIPFWAKDAVLTSGADIQEKTRVSQAVCQTPLCVSLRRVLCICGGRQAPPLCPCFVDGPEDFRGCGIL